MTQKQSHYAAAGGPSVAPHRLMLLVTIVDKGKGTFFSEYLKTFDANLQICVVGTGTARGDLVEFLGLKDSRRSIIFSVVREERLDAIMEALQERFVTVNRSRGVAFTVPLTSVIGKLSYGFLSNERRIAKGDERDGQEI